MPLEPPPEPGSDPTPTPARFREMFAELNRLATKLLRTIDTHNTLRLVSLSLLFLVIAFGPAPLIALVVVAAAVFTPLQFLRSQEMSGAYVKILQRPKLWALDYDSMIREMRHDVETDQPPPWGRPGRWSLRWLGDRAEELAAAFGVGYLVFLVVAPDAGTLTVTSAVAAGTAATLFLAVVTRVRHARDYIFDRHRRAALALAEAIAPCLRQAETPDADQ